jgi:hypothetical protein
MLTGVINLRSLVAPKARLNAALQRQRCSAKTVRGAVIASGFVLADNTSDNKVLPLRPHRDYGSTSRPSVIRPLPVRLQERTCWQALYQASPPASSA